MRTGRADIDVMLKASSIPADEPVFVLRGQDACGPDAVRYWAELAMARGAPVAVGELALQQADAMEAWPRAKLADDAFLGEPERRQLAYQHGRRSWALGARSPAELARLRGFAEGYAAARAFGSEVWSDMAVAPRDGGGFLAFGVHDGSAEDAERGVQPGDVWWAIILWDRWREPGRWVFAKDGRPTWSTPLCWQPLTAPRGHAPWLTDTAREVAARLLGGDLAHLAADLETLLMSTTTSDGGGSTPPVVSFAEDLGKALAAVRSALAAAAGLSPQHAQAIDQAIASLNTAEAAIESRVGALETRVGALETRMAALDAAFAQADATLRELGIEIPPAVVTTGSDTTGDADNAGGSDTTTGSTGADTTSGSGAGDATTTTTTGADDAGGSDTTAGGSGADTTSGSADGDANT